MTNSKLKGKLTKLVVSSIFMVVPLLATAQDGIKLGVNVAPQVAWFGSDNSAITNHGSKPGFGFGISIKDYFSENYAFTVDVNLMTVGGRLSSADTTMFDFSNKERTTSEEVFANNAINYRIQYLSFPVGLQLQTTQIGYITVFSNIGIDPKIVVSGKASIPSQDIDTQTATSELKVFNLGYHIKAGIEYSVAGNTSLVVGLGYENNFLDVTKDINDQARDKITHNILSLQLGIIF